MVTKVFVVLMAVFCIAFTMMVVAVNAQTANWRSVALQNEEHARIADANLKNLVAANAAQLASARDTIKTLGDEMQKKDAAYQALEARFADLERQFHLASGEKTSAEAMNRALSSVLDAANAERAEYRKQRDDLEQQVIELSRRNIDLNDRVNEQTSAIAVLQAEKRQLEQQVHILKKENESFASAARRVSIGSTLESAGGASMAGVTAVTPVATTPIRGQVLEVSGSRITLSVGAADGVQEGMIFVIHRGGQQYIGDVQISLVNPNECAGRIIKQATAPIPGDQVTDAAHLGARPY